METPDRPQTLDLIRALEETPFGFDFFRAVRLLEAQFASGPRLGESLVPRRDPVRFGQKPSLAFAPSTLQEFKRGDSEHPPCLYANFLGLFGPNGPLPLHITEFAHDRQHNAGDDSMVAFFDVFHHRILSLFYRAWAVNQKAADLDRPDDSHFARYIGSLCGLGMDSLRDRDAVPDWAKLYFSGRLACQTRNAEGLEAIIAVYFGIPTEVQTFRGHWMPLPESSVCRLGESPDTGSLGVTTIVGARMWDCQLKFRIRLGPMTMADMEHLLPCAEAFHGLRCWVMNYVGEEFFWDVQLVLQAEEVPGTCLGRTSRLGWTSWLKSLPMEHDADDLVLKGA
jgi:type VI secretion system protein ImpH